MKTKTHTEAYRKREDRLSQFINTQVSWNDSPNS